MSVYQNSMTVIAMQSVKTQRENITALVEKDLQEMALIALV